MTDPRRLADTPVVIAVRKGSETNDVVAQIQNLADCARKGNPIGDEDDVWYECGPGQDAAVAAPLLDQFAEDMLDLYGPV